MLPCFATWELRYIQLVFISGHLAKLLFLWELHKHGFSSMLGRKWAEVVKAAQRHYLHPRKFSPEMYYTAARPSASVLSYPVVIPADQLKSLTQLQSWLWDCGFTENETQSCSCFPSTYSCQISPALAFLCQKIQILFFFFKKEELHSLFVK